MLPKSITKKGTIVITGSAGGIGTGFISQFLLSPHIVNYHCVYTYHPTVPLTLSSLLASAPPKHTYDLLPLDQTSIPSLQTFTQHLTTNSALPPIRCILLIAGGVFPSSCKHSAKHFETTFQVNYFSNYILLSKLLPVLALDCRIVFMSSTTHDPRWISNRLGAFKDYRELFPLKKDWLRGLAEGTTERDGLDFDAAMRRYGTSKMLMNMLMYSLDRRLLKSPKYEGISMLALDPGAVGGTSLYTHFPLYLYIVLAYILIPIQSFMVYFFPNGRFRTVEKTGQDLLLACFDEARLGKRPGAIYLNGSEKAESSVESRDVEKQEEVWRESWDLAREVGGVEVEGMWKDLEV